MSSRFLMAMFVWAGVLGLPALRAQTREAVNAPKPGAMVGEAVPLSPAVPTSARDPRDVQLAYYLDEGFFETGIKNFEAAIAAFRKALELSPNHLRALFGLGTALISAERELEAEAVLSEASRLYPQDFPILNNLAWLYATARDPRIRNGRFAVEIGRQALILNPSDLHVWSTMAEAYYVSGDYERASRYADEALRMARQSGQSSDIVEEYSRQFQRCHDAALALSILD